MTLVATERTGDIALIIVDNPPVNALGHAVRSGLAEAFAALKADPPRAAVLLCAGRTFMAGADVREFGQTAEPPAIYEVAEIVEALPFPVVAALHGNALGGGLEMALGCHGRIALAGTRIGFPEVTLGVIPGSGGVVRTVRVTPLAEAVPLITGGKPVSAETAQALGLVDRVVSFDLREAAIAFAEELAAGRLPTPLSQRDAPADPGPDFWAEQETDVRRKARGAEAPLVALDVLRQSCGTPFEAARRVERAAFERLRDAPQAAALRHVFFAERRAAKSGKSGGARDLRHVGVVGGGTMGAGIATACLQRGLAVTLAETTLEAAEAARARIASAIAAAAKRGLVPDEAGTLSRLIVTTDFSAFAQADLVIEAVFEDLAVKRDVFARLGEAVRPQTILATNTSYLDPRKIAAGLADASRFVGLHFFSPAQVMKLVEIVPVPETSEEALATASALIGRLGKIGVKSGICEGFIGNRILKRYRAEAESLVRTGVPVAEVDAAMRGYGFAMGPFEAQDLGGLDIAFRQREAARAAGESVPETLGDHLVRAGRLGQKSGGGWYDYAEGDRRPKPSEAVDALLRQAGVDASDTAGDPADIAERLVAGMAEEGAAIIAEGIAGEPGEIDLVEIHGYGFPRWRGGPMHAARSLGRSGLARALTREPSADLLRLLKAG
ncbi:3-hydroxyacyl-CoA dehydrogenase NAD-binding domain-containing protein [Aurantimonas sp. VKM B-3413]|uniref:3-hydroxyacyl-CoA dehydrogenase NAD-binding domain-containing protein n=1 Tax=Aurantimonas sp. VKM B-3413 TaxID=2779401 RepID=UPI001E464376|nr:3-hydroxyacyl-CoA dehydrogenase NAD-binding domain-containing protein [Aurantimonas sp. VKM B-3413]MCB8836369.1 enoyl-CoA hydratase/isomerase family protein [Aurantimonas sp. VKM B-3413]